MAYIGNIPADKYQTLQKQSFTTSATDTYTLSYSVTNPQDLGLFINNVRQNPNDAYTVSGTTLTLSSAITSSDTMYAVFLGRAVETVAPALSSVTNDMLAGSIANSKLANSSITLNGSAVSLGGSASVGGTNTPIAILYRPDVVQTISDATWTLATYTQTSYDPSNIASVANSRITPNVAGHYLFLYSTRLQNSNTARVLVSAQKNGGAVGYQQSDTGEVTANASGSYATVKSWFIDQANGSSDYFHFRIYHNTGSNAAFLNSSLTCFKLIT